ncbi:alpha-amylase family glycosyl hydrolase [Prosthecomicrobium sp. N25]|uniref:alpha-amylase family glycosyl hydrolase n=1 Tax=Prosthecomicrobium sp. N25 TaxID=3129254 RepID=UPI003077E6D4
MRSGRPRPWWQTGIVYEIYVRSFQDTDGDGVGDLAGIAARADYLADLGVDAVWLTPFYPSPMADFGYDVADYVGVDPVYGTLADFDAMLAALRDRGIRTVLDLVPNHTSDRHPWFVESCASRTSPRRAWYVWRDAAPDGGLPNNWLSQSGASAWTFDPATGQYYLHSFLPEQPDLDWRNPAVRSAILDVMRFWLDRGVAGFRVDVFQGLLKDPAFRDDPPNPDFRDGDPTFTRLAQTNSSNQPGVVDIAAGMRALLAGYPGDPVLIGEIYAPVERLAGYYGPGLSGVQLPFNFNLFAVPWEAAAIRDLVLRYEAALPDGAWPNWVLGNHDIARVATRLGPAQARIAMMLLLTLRGTPTLYQGDELGMEDVEVPPDRVRDSFARFGKGRGRDPERAPMPWDEGPYRGFSRVEPWLPAPAPGRPPSAATQAGEPGSLLALTRALVALRRAEPALSEGSWRAVSAPDGVLAYDRAEAGRTCRVVLNLTPRAATVEVPAGMRIAVGSHGPLWDRAGTTIRLRPDEGLVLVPPPADGSETGP